MRSFGRIVTDMRTMLKLFLTFKNRASYV
jgi:hypothetical protein